MLGLLYLKSQKDPRNVPRDEERGRRMPHSADDCSLGPLRCFAHTPSDGFSAAF